MPLAAEISGHRGALRGTPEALTHSPGRMPLSCRAGNGAENAEIARRLLWLISAAKGLGFSWDISEGTLPLINSRLVVD